MPKFRRPLNDKQLLILKVLYKFRFITIELMCRDNTKKARDVMYGRLCLLLEQGYIVRKYDKSYRLMNKAASYCLAPRGIQALHAQPGLNPAVLHAAYRDRSASEEFIQHSLLIFRIYRLFENLYQGKINILTKSETSGYDYYPRKVPDIHLYTKDYGSSDFFLDVVEGNYRPFVLRHKILGYSQHCDNGSWEEVTNKNYPILLLICATPAIERSLQRRVPRWLNTEGITTYTTTFMSFLNAESTNNEIWIDVDNPDVFISI